MSLKYFNKRICLNVLAGSLENAKQIYEASGGRCAVGRLTADYENIEESIDEFNHYNEVLNGTLSVGLGGGNPNQWREVARVVEDVKAGHINQVFTGVGFTRAKVANDTSIINVLVSPTGKPGFVNVATGPLSSKAEQAVVSIDTAILMAKDMGGSSIKFFPMNGLETIDELKEVAKACKKHNFILEPTGGISLENYEQIIRVILDEGVDKIIPHIYGSIMDQSSKSTDIEKFNKLISITERVLKDY